MNIIDTVARFIASNPVLFVSGGMFIYLVTDYVRSHSKKVSLVSSNNYTSHPYREPAFKFNSEIKEEKRVMKLKMPDVSSSTKMFLSFLTSFMFLFLLCVIWDTNFQSGFKWGITLSSGGMIILFIGIGIHWITRI